MTVLAGRKTAEDAIREHQGRGDYRLATTVAMNTYGQELFRFVRVTVGCEDDAGDVNSELWEEIYNSLPRFEWRASFRTWAYTLARHACARFLRHPRRDLFRPLSDADLSCLEQRLRTTNWRLKDELRDKVAALRERLAPDQRSLLYMRVDQRMSWGKICEIMKAEGGAQNEAALRQQFARLKKQLRELARAEHLLPET